MLASFLGRLNKSISRKGLATFISLLKTLFESTINAYEIMESPDYAP